MYKLEVVGLGQNKCRDRHRLLLLETDSAQLIPLIFCAADRNRITSWIMEGRVEIK